MAPFFHLAVIGTRFPQLALATMMAKRGRKVLVVDGMNPDDHAKEPVKGYLFRKRPTPLFGLDGGGFLRRFLVEIGIGQVLVNETYPSNAVSYQVVLPRNRINVYPDRDMFLAELAREFPHALETMRAMYVEWDELAGEWREGLDNVEDIEKAWHHARGLTRRLSGVWQARKLRDQFRSLDPDSAEMAFFNIQNHLLGARPFKAPVPALSTSLIHSIGRRGTYRESSGTRGITELMLQRFREYGGVVIGPERVARLEQPARDNLVLTLDSGDRVQSRTMCTTEGLAREIQDIWQGRRTPSGRDTAPGYPVRFYIGMREKVVPLGMEDNLFMMREGDGGPLGLKCCYLAMSPAGSDASEKGRRSLTVTSFLPGDRLAGLTDTLIEDVSGDILEALEAVIPFLNEGLDHFSCDLSANSESGSRRALGSGITAWTPGIVGRMAVAARYRGRVAVIRPTPNELGIEGEALAALSAANVLRKAMGTEG